MDSRATGAILVFCEETSTKGTEVATKSESIAWVDLALAQLHEMSSDISWGMVGYEVYIKLLDLEENIWKSEGRRRKVWKREVKRRIVNCYARIIREHIRVALRAIMQGREWLLRVETDLSEQLLQRVLLVATACEELRERIIQFAQGSLEEFAYAVQLREGRSIIRRCS